jgi:hypothetical protein
MTLALLLTAVTGAWAAEPELLVTITIDSNGNPVYSAEGLVTLTGTNYTFDEINGKYFWFPTTPSVTMSATVAAAADNVSITKVVFWSSDIGNNGDYNNSLEDTAAPYVCYANASVSKGGKSLSDDFATKVDDINISKIEVYGTAETIEVIPVAEPAANTKQWTFTQPGSDVVLTPIYSAATIYSGQTETPFETLKEAFANVKNGDVIKLDWNVTLTETVETLLRNGAIKFTLDLNGYIIDGMTPEYAIRLRNGDLMTITDSSLGQTGGLKCQDLVGEQYAKFIFDGGRYTMGQLTADFLNTVCSGAAAALLLAEGKEFTDIENAPDADGFMVRVGFKTFELTIGAGKFATFYDDNNIEFAEKPAEGVGLYTISSIDADRSKATVTPISGIIPAGTPMLVYNGSEQKQTAKLIVTLDDAQDAITVAREFQGTATDREFTAGDMAAADYYALSGGKAFAPVKGAGILGANQCWLQFDKQEIPSARQFTLVFDSEATGIKTTDCTDYTDSVWYDLNGRKVAAPTKKGIYIQNGRKVVK